MQRGSTMFRPLYSKKNTFILYDCVLPLWQQFGEGFDAPHMGMMPGWDVTNFWPYCVAKGYSYYVNFLPLIKIRVIF